MAGISICNDGSEVVDVCLFSTFRQRGRQAGFALLPVVEALGFEQMLNFVRDRVLDEWGMSVTCKNTEK